MFPISVVVFQWLYRVDGCIIVIITIVIVFLSSRWLSHVRTVLTSAWTVAFKAHAKRAPVLVHCSHGWDRTSQVALEA